MSLENKIRETKRIIARVKELSLTQIMENQIAIMEKLQEIENQLPVKLSGNSGPG